MKRKRRVTLVRGCLAILLLLGVHCGDDPGVADGSGPTPTGIDRWPCWCPTDSSVIAYTHSAITWEEYLQYGPESVWLIDIETLERTLIGSGEAHDWNPDGTRILIELGCDIWSVDVTSGNRTKVTDCDCKCGRLRFSPDGTEISYTVGYYPGGGTWILNLSSEEEIHISDKFAGDWSPSGEELICDSLIVITRAGERVEKISYSPELGYPGNACWSPDGETLAFMAEGGIWATRRSGADETELVDSGFYPSWAPNGRELAYSALSANGKGSVIWILDTASDERTQITTPEPYIDSR